MTIFPFQLLSFCSPSSQLCSIRTSDRTDKGLSDLSEYTTTTTKMSSHPGKTINPSDVPDPQPQFSQVNTFTVNGPTKIVAITGQLAIQPDGKSPTPKAFDDQVKLALQNLENCLKAAGASKRDIFKVTHYVVDFDFEKKNPAAIFCDWLGIDHRPASVMSMCHVPVRRRPADCDDYSARGKAGWPGLALRNRMLGHCPLELKRFIII